MGSRKNLHIYRLLSGGPSKPVSRILTQGLPTIRLPPLPQSSSFLYRVSFNLHLRTGLLIFVERGRRDGGEWAEREWIMDVRKKHRSIASQTCLAGNQICSLSGVRGHAPTNSASQLGLVSRFSMWKARRGKKIFSRSIPKQRKEEFKRNRDIGGKDENLNKNS